MLQHKDRCSDFIVAEVFDKKVVVPILFVIALIVVYRSFLPSFNLPLYFHVHFFCSCLIFFIYLPHLSQSFIFCSSINTLSISHLFKFLPHPTSFFSFFIIFFSPSSFLPHYPPPFPSSLSLPLIRSLSQGSTNSNMLDVQGGAHKKRVRRSSLLNAKKLYEDAQMARKVKQYLSNLTVETDEEKHQIMSLQCEPSYSTCE